MEECVLYEVQPDLWYTIQISLKDFLDFKG